MKRFLIADDYSLIRIALRQVLSTAFVNAHIEEAEDAEELLQKAMNAEWDLIITDITMPGRSGLDILQQLKLSHPKLPVLVLSMHPEETYAIRAIKAGAAGYLKKDLASKEIVKAIERILQGKKYIPLQLAEKLVTALEHDASGNPHEQLSPREFEIALLLASGMTLKEIADKLMLGASTVSTYRTRIMEKMNLKTNRELTLYAITHKLI